MATAQIRTVLQHLRKAVLTGKGGNLTDAQLLDCYLTRHEEAAFEALVRRHGPMVLGVCRRVLGNAHDAEDAFQATFLVLVRKAATIRPRERVGNWLHGVAYRTALKARLAASRRQAREAVMSRNEAVPPDQPNDWRAVLDQEVQCLPEKYRAALVLCDLEGKTRKEAARQLGWADGTLSTRLTRARGLLVERLSRRGVTISAVTLTAALAEHSAAAFVPAGLVAATVQVQRLIGLASAAGAIPPTIAALMEGVVKSMAMVKAKKLLAIALIALSTIGFGIGGYSQLPAEEPTAAEDSLRAKVPAAATEGKPLSVPSGPMLKPALVSLLSDGQVVIKRGLHYYEPVTGPGIPSGYRRALSVQMQVYDRATVRVFDSRGHRVEERKLPRLLKKEIVAFIVHGPDEPDPVSFQLLREGTLVLQVPTVAVVPPPPATAVTTPTHVYRPLGTSSQPIPGPPAPRREQVIFRTNVPGTASYAAVFDKVQSILGEYFQVTDANRFDGMFATAWRVDVPEDPDAATQEIRRRANAQIQVMDDAADFGYYSIRVQVHKEAKKGKSKWQERGRDTELEQVILRRLAEHVRQMSAPSAVPMIAPPPPMPPLPTYVAPLPSNSQGAPPAPLPPAAAAPPPVPAGVPATAQTAPKTPAPAFQTVFFAGNPTSERYKQVFDKVLEIVGEYFEIEDANRFDGRIQTVPRLGVPAKFLAIDTLGEQSLPAGQERRRRASVQIVAADVGGYFVQVQVPVEAKKVSAAGKESGWSQIGRHTELEQVMLRRLAEQARLTAPAPPPAPAVPLSVPAPAVPLRPPTGAAPAPDPALRPLPVSPLNWERLPPPLPSGPLR